MSNFTTELRNIIESPFFDIETEALTEYPIFDEAYRGTLNNKILDHYRFHEIGYETGERFIYELNRKMKEIMPYFNQLYQSELLAIDPLLTFKETKTEDKTIAKDGTITVDHDSTEVTDETRITDIDRAHANQNDSKSVSSDTPSSVLLSGDITGDTYATEISVDDNDSTGTENVDESVDRDMTVTNATDSVTTTDMDTVENKTVTTEGFEDMSMSDLLIKHRKTLLNIDMLVIERLRTLFMLIYGEI